MGFAIVFLAFFVFLLVFRLVSADRAIVAFLDVGQGDSAFIRTPYGQNILIDGGPDNKVIKKLGKYLPFWDQQIDAVILTHPHDDHVTGLDAILKKYRVSSAYYAGSSADNPNYGEFVSLLSSQRIATTIVRNKQRLRLSDDCFLDIADLGSGSNNLNDRSLVGRLECRGRSYVFMADLEKTAEPSFIRLHTDWQSDVMKIGHHGSDTSSSDELLSVINPEEAVISVGAGNKLGHPSRRVLKRLERGNIKIRRTDEEGDIVYNFQ